MQKPALGMRPPPPIPPHSPMSSGVQTVSNSPVPPTYTLHAPARPIDVGGDPSPRPHAADSPAPTRTLRLITDWLDHNRYHRRPVVLRFPRSSRRPLSHLIPRTRRAYQVCYRMEPIHCLCLQPECSQGGRPLHFPRPLCRPSQRQTMCRLTTTDHRPSSRPPRHSLRRCPHMRRTSSHRTYSTHRTSLTCRV